MAGVKSYDKRESGAFQIQRCSSTIPQTEIDEINVLARQRAVQVRPVCSVGNVLASAHIPQRYLGDG